MTSLQTYGDPDSRCDITEEMLFVPMKDLTESHSLSDSTSAVSGMDYEVRSHGISQSLGLYFCCVWNGLQGKMSQNLTVSLTLLPLCLEWITR